MTTLFSVVFTKKCLDIYKRMDIMSAWQQWLT